MNRVIKKKQKSSKPGKEDSEEQVGEDEVKEVKVEKDKHEKKLEKQMDKFQGSIDRCYRWILDNEITKAIQNLKDIIIDGQFLDKHEFKGLGIDEHWMGRFPKGPLEWFSKPPMHQFISRNPFDLLSISFMIQLIDKTISLSQVITSYEKFPQQQRAQIQMGLGNAYYNSFMFLKAEQHYLRALQTKQTEVMYENMAWVSGVIFDRNAKGIQYADKCLKINAQNPGAIFIKSQCQQDSKQAEKMSLQLLKLYPNYYRVYVFLGNIEEDNREKQGYYLKALNFDPNYLIASILLALTKAKQDEDGARQTINKLLEQNPNSYKVQWGLAQLQQESDNNSDSTATIEHYQKVLTLNPYHFQTMGALAYHYRLQDSTKEAIQFYEQYIKLNPYNEQMFNYLGLAYDDEDRKDEGVECYLKALNLNPNYFQSLSNLGLSCQQSQKYTQAIDAYLRAIKVKPESCGIYYGLAICHMGVNQFDQAQKYGQQCIAKGGDEDKEVYEFMGDLFFKKQAFGTSMNWYLQHVTVTKHLNTEYIMENMINNMPKVNVLNILNEIINNTFKSRDPTNMWAYLQIGKLLVQLEEEEVALKAFEIVRRQHTRAFGVDRKIKRELRSVFGDPEIGSISMVEKIRWQKLRKEYLEAFQKIYGTDKEMKPE